MTLWRLLLRNLLYHWRGNLAVLLGVAVGAAVLTGALLVGDALRGSLRALALQRLGWVDQALIASRFVRADLADGLPAERVAPVILLRATAANRDGKTVRRVSLLGVDERFGLGVPDWPGASEGVVLAPALARELGVGVGDEVTLRVQKPSDVPRESLLGKHDEESVSELTLKVEAVLGDDDPGARFSLQPSPEAPRNAYVSLALLQKRLGQEGRVNALLAGGAREGLAEAFQAKLDLDAWGLKLYTPAARADALIARYSRKGGEQGRPPVAESILHAIDHTAKTAPPRDAVEKYYRDKHPYLSLESREAILDRASVDAALEAADEAKLRAAPTLVYLAKFRAGSKTIAGVVAALDPTQEKPLGPLLPKGVKELKPGEIVLVDWQDHPAPTAPEMLKPPAKVKLIYKPAEHSQDRLADLTADFDFAGTIPMAGPAADPDLTPSFPGLTDKADPSQWKLPFDDPDDPKDPWRRDVLRREWGDPYWYEYRTTPKAYIRLEDGRKIWKSRFGDTTSVRLAPRSGSDLDDAARDFEKRLIAKLKLGTRSPAFQPVKAAALGASVGGSDFGALFLAFSCFLIAAALLLVGLLFRLNLDRRAAEVGLLRAAGYRVSTVRWLLLGEGAVLALLGAALGCAVALGYAAALLQFLAAIWPGGALKSFLKPHFEDSALSLLIGGGASVLVSMGTIAWAAWGLGRVPPRALLAGQAHVEPPSTPGRVRWSWWVAGISLIVALVLVGCAPFISGSEEKASAFFGSGALLLTAALAGLSGWMRTSRHRTVEGRGAWAIVRLGVRNAARHPGRSLLTVGLLASASFLIVAVESFRRHADAGATSKKSGSGGFNLLAESDRPPPYRDLTGPKALPALLDRLETQRWATFPTQQARDAQRQEAGDLLKQLKVYPIRVKSGDDASCLNLYQPTRPRLFGVPKELMEEDRFLFAAVGGDEPKEANPWQLLRRKLKPPEGQKEPPLPAFGEQNTVVWMLKKGLGGTVKVPSEGAGPPERTLRIDGLLQDSVFQSGLLLSEENFLTLYPSNDGPTFFLIEAPPGREAEVKDLLEAALGEDVGLEVTRTADRLEQYLEVENTYLTTFQALGGLGLLLGSLGLAVVLLRGVWERRGELALLRALGWRRRTLAGLVLAENGFLLLLGLAAGALAAAAAVAPHVGGGVPWLRLLGLLGGVLAVGLAAAALAATSTLRAPLLTALRRE